MHNRRPWTKWYRQSATLWSEVNRWYEITRQARDEALTPEQFAQLDEQCGYLFQVGSQAGHLAALLARRPRW